MDVQEFEPGQGGHGEASLAELSELRKALEIGYQQPTTGVGFDALRVESLESTLKLLTFNATHLKLWNQIPKLEAYSTVEEYNLLREYGDDAGGFVSSGDLPEEEDSVYERADQKVKFMGTTRAVHHPSTLVRTVPADLIAQETQNGALWLMGKANRSLYYGNAANVSVEFNGLASQILTGGGIVIDLQGNPLSQNNIEDAAEAVIENFGMPSKLFSNPKVFTDFSKLYQGYQRINQPNNQPGTAGTPITGYKTLSGDIGFEGDVFVKRGGVVPSQSPAKAPSAPTLVVTSAGASTGSSFLSGDAGTYKWQVTAVNKYGESAPCALSSGVSVSAGDGVTLAITDGGGAYPAESYKIYRTEKGGATTYWTNYAVPRAKSGGIFTSPTSYLDINTWRPRTFIGMMLDMTPQSLSFKQLSPMLKMNLAVVSPAIRWMQLLYGTPIVYAPGKNVLFTNIGSAS